MIVRNLNKRLNRFIKYLYFRFKVLFKKDEKIFIIGRNKTGTTSLKIALERLGYFVGDQATAELFIDDYERSYFENILKYCDSAEVFQDAPFSWPETYKYVYQKYPYAKYILLERESAEIWFDSLLRFHKKIVNDGSEVTADKLKSFKYRRKGFLWQVAIVVYGVNESTLYDKSIYIENYEKYNSEVKAFFKEKDNFLSLILSKPDANKKLAAFLNKKLSDVIIPHANKST